VSGPSGDDATDWEIEAARAGDDTMLGWVLESCRTYLLAVAERGLAPDLLAKGGPSDVVQETLLGAYRDFTKFRGATREELLAWLRTILRNHLAVLRRRYRDTLKRRVSAEVSLGVPGSSGSACWLLASDAPTPSAHAVRQEQVAALLRALERLPEEYRRVVAWHHHDGLTFEAIGVRMGRSAEAARKLWSRALIRLAREMEPDHEPR
jgi:RNA polymerase sigma-70 factor (ECF subfamily)